MADVKWIKVDVDMFHNRKIRHLRRMEHGNDLALIWVMLLTLAGECNAGGTIYLTESIPYTMRTLADELNCDVSTVNQALKALSDLGMISITNGFISVNGWCDHQNIDGMEKARDSKRLAQARWREKNKSANVDISVDSTVDIYKDSTVDENVDSTKTSTRDACRISVDHAEKNKNKNRLDKNIDKSIKYGAFNNVSLTDEEIKKLQEEYGVDKTNAAIEFLSAYISEKGYKTKNHYLTLKRWVFKAVDERTEKNANVEYGCSGSVGEAEKEAIRLLMES